MNNSIAIPDFIIPDEIIEKIKEQILGRDKFYQEFEQDGWCLDISGTARVQNFYEKETNCHWSDIDQIEIKIVLWDPEVNQVDFSDEFEKDIFGQINVISK